MRKKIILSSILTFVFYSAPAIAADNSASSFSGQLQGMLDDGKQATKDAGDSLINAIPALPPLPGEEKPVDPEAKKAADASLSAPAPTQLAPLPPVDSNATLTPAATPTAAPASNTVDTLPLPATLASPPVPKPQDSTPLPIMSNQPKPVDPNAPLISNDPAWLPSPGNKAAKAPTMLPFSIPSNIVPTQAPPVVVTPAAPAVAPAQNVATTEPKKVVKRTYKKRAPGVTKVRYRNIRLPDTIYKKQYDKVNKYLPVAYYESDWDAQLFVAVRHDNINGVRAMLDYSKRGINKPNAKGQTPLMVAAQSNAVNTTRLLLGRHADMHAQDANGQTALQIARQNGNSRIVNLLETMGGDTQLAQWQPEPTVNYNNNPKSPLQLIEPRQPDIN